ncbi:H+-ATPase G subunit-domain-containing protein [Polychytrium aggregatum]|uniref:H+-ATPase G subunit-domain-containing protein n=1 Tax=Polychytrium aggregatum TaxID=110093 RepID=UPI0022FE11C6|nr:H+-ATPase G subunit-domain-containing protein [Polychytrium aggregatum]KAI9208624.1 H+-ATPase G subunit-domain-containing protein [Polychytrium aggregatum]
MSQSNNQGISTLLEAEKEASKVIQKARQYRVQRLKDARSEAAKEIDVLKGEKQQEFVQFEQQFAGSSDSAFAGVTKETDDRLTSINAAYLQHKHTVIDKMLAAVENVHPKIHPNAIPVSREA